MKGEVRDQALTSGAACDKRGPSEWLDLKSRAEDEKLRILTAHLERRKARRFLHLLEEERKVTKELNNMQRDRRRFEREKQLRHRNSLSSTREKRQLRKKSHTEVTTGLRLPVNEKSFGGSASLAFDPSVEKTSSHKRLSSNASISSRTSDRKAPKESECTSCLPYIDEEDAQRFHKLCKSASRSECRRWGAAWYYAKREQDMAMDNKKRWTALLLEAEKEKMRVLSEKGINLMASGVRSKDAGNLVYRKAKSGENSNSGNVLNIDIQFFFSLCHKN